MAQRHTQNWALMQNSFATTLPCTITKAMSIEIEPVADIATGAIIATAVEPGEGEASGIAISPCLNCGAQLDGAFCKNCGQKAQVHRTLGAFWHDFTHSIFHFEGKIWRTLPMLAFKPGDLTRRYIRGERARYVSPLALFLFSVFLMFASFNQIGVPIGPKAQTSRNGAVIDRATMAKEIAVSRAKIEHLEAKRAAAKRGGQATAPIDEEIASEREDLSGLQIGYDLSDGIDATDLIKIDTGDRAKRTTIDGKGSVTNDFSVDAVSQSVLAKLDKGLQNPNLLMYKVQSNAYKFSWLLIPLSLPFLWLLFVWKREYLIYDHIVFITYSLSSITLLLAVASVCAGIAFLEPLVIPLLLIVPPVHMFLQLKGAYRLSVTSSLWRTVVMQVAAVLVLVSFSLILFALGLAG